MDQWTKDEEARRLEERERRARVDAAIERLEAEVREHEGDDEMVCPSCGRPFALHGIACETLSGQSLRTPIEQPAKPAGPRFGERLREWLNDLRPTNPAWEVLRALADAIDRDAARLTADRDAWKEQARHWWGKAIRRREPANLRRRIEETVEELRQSVRMFRDDPDDIRDRDVVEAEDLLARLPGIFGAREEKEDES